MLFNSTHFLLFFPIVVAIYFICPRHMRYIWLLISSYYFYMSWNVKYALLIAFSTLATYMCGILIESTDRRSKDYNRNSKRIQKLIIGTCIIVNLGILFFYKYINFSINSVNRILIHFDKSPIEQFDIILPVGISFYTFQALSYVIDVYRGDVNAEKNILKYALFVSFFPQLVAGPIERSKNLIQQISEAPSKNLFDYSRIANGLIIMLWGYFMKMMIADRAAVLVNTVYGAYKSFGAVELIVATIFFSLQIYCDFSSYSLIATGAAQIMGFNLMENFNCPYFSQSIKEFWRRWHISLGSWFRDYLYIPLGGNRCGKARKYLNLIITFLCSGLWHGAAWSYVIWGFLHGTYQVIGEILAQVKERICVTLHVRTETVGFRFWKISGTYLLVCFGWIFFRANSLHDAGGIIWRICTERNPWAILDGTLYTLGLDHAEMIILMLSCMLLFLVDLIKYLIDVRIDIFLERENMAFRWVCLMIVTISIFVFGIYGISYDPQAFIYFQF